MTRPILTLPPKAKTLAQQNADFTAEGAPPPGTVAMSIPETGSPVVKPITRTPNAQQETGTMDGSEKQQIKRLSKEASVKAAKMHAAVRKVIRDTTEGS